MIEAAFWMFVGAFLAWGFVPEPKLVADLRNKLIEKVPALSQFVKR